MTVPVLWHFPISHFNEKVRWPPEIQYPPAPIPSELLEYQAALAARPALPWVTEMYRRHRGRSAEVAAA